MIDMMHRPAVISGREWMLSLQRIRILSIFLSAYISGCPDNFARQAMQTCFVPSMRP